MKFFVVFALAFAAACAAPSGEDSSMMMDASMMPMDMGDGEGKMMMSEGDMEKVMKVAMKMKMVKMMVRMKEAQLNSVIFKFLEYFPFPWSTKGCQADDG